MADFMNQFVAKGVQNRYNGNIMCWWKTNFNMPVPNISDTTTWLEGYGPVAYDTPDTSFDLSGFSPGFEAVAFFTIFHWEYPTVGNATLYAKWLDPDDNVMFSCIDGYTMAVSNPNPTDWTEYWVGCNQGVAGWEIDTGGDYKVQSWATGTAAITLQEVTITFSNVPATTQLGSDKPGYIWVEGNDLCYINANEWKHTIVGTSLGYVDTGKAGYMWIDNSDDLHWIGGDGDDYKVPWKIQQFASTWSNGPTHATNAGTSKKGYIWVDEEFGYTHLAYIGYNGYKFLVGAGHYPYQLSY